ncbi:hypothetical protein ACG04Q_17170 [Roseateles sp. DXS20W]|uniref:ATP-binding protein n=1 Tax=Pelomonas lactea TaxID=3299030 RepID=A0ABW7GN90_9BURK
MPASHRARIRRFLAFYLGDAENPVPFGGRDLELQQLNRWLAAPDGPDRLLLTAPAAGGKSALLTHWISGTGMAGWRVVFVPISIRYETNRPDVFFAALAAALADARGLGVLPAPAGDPAQHFRDKVIELLDDWPAAAPRCLVVIDGLDEATGWQLDDTVLPTAAQPGLRLLVSAREMSGCDAGEWRRRIGWTRSRVQHLPLGRLQRPAVGELLGQVPLQVPAAVRDDLADALFRVTEGDPLLLQLHVVGLLDAQARGEPVDLPALQRQQPGFSAFFDRWMAQQSGLDRDLVKALLAILACAAGPLRHADLEGLVPRVLGQPCVVDADSLRPIQRFVVGDGVRQGYAFGHPKFGIYVREEWLARGPWVPAAQRAFLDWGGDVLAALAAGTQTQAPAYLLNFLFLHLRQHGEPLGRWAALASDGWRRAWEQQEDGASGFARDVQEVLRQARGPALQGDGAALALVARASLILSSLRSRGSALKGSLLAAAVRTGVMSRVTAAHLARGRLEPGERVDTLLWLAADADEGWRQRLFEEVLAILDALDEPLRRVRRLLAVQALGADIADRLSDEDRALVLEPQGVKDVRAMAGWLRWLPAERAAYCDRALTLLAEMASFDGPGEVIDVLKPWLDEGQAERALDLLSSKDIYSRPELELIPLLPLQRLPELFGVVLPYHFTVPRHAVAGLAALARRLPLAALVPLRDKVMRAALPDEAQLEDAGAPLDAPALLRQHLSGLALVDALMPLLPLLPAPQAREALDDMLGSLREAPLSDVEDRLALLAHAIPDACVMHALSALLGMGLPPEPLGPLAVRLSDTELVALIAAHNAACRAMPVLLEDAALHERVGAEALRGLLALGLGIADLSEQACLWAAFSLSLPAEAAGLRAHAQQLMRQQAASRQQNWREAMVHLAPWLEPPDFDLAVSGPPWERMSGFSRLAPVMGDEQLPVLLAAFDRAGITAIEQLLPLAQRFAKHPALAHRLPEAILAEGLLDARRYQRLLGSLAIEQREAVALLAWDHGAHARAAMLFAALLATAPDSPQAGAWWERLLHHLDPPALSEPASGEKQPERADEALRADCLALAAPSLAWVDVEIAQTAHDMAIGLAEPRARAVALFGLLAAPVYGDELRAWVRDEAIAALDDIADPQRAAELLAAGAAALGDAQLRDRQAALLRAARASDREDPQDLLFELVAAPGGEQAFPVFVEVAMQEVGTFAPELAREFRDDLRFAVEAMLRQFMRLDEHRDDLSIPLLLRGVAALEAAEQRRLLVHGLVVCAFLPRVGWLLIVAELLRQGVPGDTAFVAALRADAEEVLGWYP